MSARSIFKRPLTFSGGYAIAFLIIAGVNLIFQLVDLLVSGRVNWTVVWLAPFAVWMFISIRRQSAIFKDTATPGPVR